MYIILFLLIAIVLLLNVCSCRQNEDATSGALIPQNTPMLDTIPADEETLNLIYGKWRVEKLLDGGKKFATPEEWPKIINDEIVVQRDLFSSKGLANYAIYQYEIQNPKYIITLITYNADDFYRIWKIDLPIIGRNDVVKFIQVATGTASADNLYNTCNVSMFAVGGDKLLLLIDAVCYELIKE